MCYMVYISTDCGDDLATQASGLVSFQTPSTGSQSPCPRPLKHQHKWFVGSKSGCSCTFRHLCRESVELGFGEPEEWYPEEADNIEATRRLYDILKSMVQRGFQVEVLDCWSGDEDKDVLRMDASLSRISRDQFRMFEGYLFTVTP